MNSQTVRQESGAAEGRPIVYLMRGLPGSGKSHTVAERWGESVAVFSADNFPGRYNKPLDPKKIAEAHPWCFAEYSLLLGNCINYEVLGMPNWPSAIVIDNTNISASECAPYILAASAYGLSHRIITRWCDPIVAFNRNKHEVPLKVIIDMYRRLLGEALPPFWNHDVEPG